MAALAAHLPRLERDPRNEAFFDPRDPAVVYRDKVRETSGLGDLVVVAVVRPHTVGIFHPHTLELVAWLSDRIAALEGVDPDGVESLATVNDIVGTEDGLRVERFFERPRRTQAQADALRTDVMDLDVYLGSLVARDGSATLIAAEVLDDRFHERVYERVLELAAGRRSRTSSSSWPGRERRPGPARSPSPSAPWRRRARSARSAGSPPSACSRSVCCASRWTRSASATSARASPSAGRTARSTPGSTGPRTSTS